MFEKIKAALRLTDDALDEEINDNIKAALADMCRVGVESAEEEKLIGKCVELYCKAQMNFCGEGERYEKQYERLRDALSLCARYNGGDKN